MADKITIFDTTLRDGDQAPGFAFSREEKVEFARQLYSMGVNVIEAGFAASSPGDYEGIREICNDIGKENVVICSLARANGDIDCAAKSLEKAKYPRIHTFIATSDIHIERKYGKTKSWVLENAIEAVKKAKKYVDDVEFSCEDFSRSNLDFVVKVVSEAVKSGAKTINLPDTVGCFYPYEIKDCRIKAAFAYPSIKYVIEEIRKIGLNPIFSVHNHNDRGLATANTLAGIAAGARQAEVTVNGIGERSGNTALEEIIENLNHFYNYKHGIKTKMIYETSRMCCKFTGQEVQRNKPIVGANSFMHEAGIHTDGMIKDKETYESVKPEDYGRKTEFWIGRKSGSAAVRKKYAQLNLSFDDEIFNKIFERFKTFADKKKEITDSDLINIAKRS